MPSIVLTDVVKRWKDFYATDHVSLDIPDKSFITLLGPSGCGKTTILRRIAGLETPTTGQIKIGDTVVFDSEAGINIPANKRDVGFLFQNYALWPNRTVYQNITFGLKNVKERLPRYDYRYKTRKDIVRVLEDPKKIVRLVNDARDKKGRIIDSRAIIKIIDEFEISQYTAKEIFKLHLEDGDIGNKVDAKIKECQAEIDQLKTNWTNKDIQILDDGQLVQIPGYAARVNAKEDVASFVECAYNLEKAGETLKEENRLFGVERKLSEKNPHLSSHIGKRKEILPLLPKETADKISKDIQDREENLSSYLAQKDKINDFFSRVSEALHFLGDDSIHRTVLLLQQLRVSYASKDEGKVVVQRKSNDKTRQNYSLQISQGIEPYFDKLVTAIAHGTLDDFYASLKKEIAYLPEEDQNTIIKAFELTEQASYKADRKENKAARKRFLDQAERVVPEAKDNVIALINQIDEAKKNHSVKEFLAKADETCLGTEEAIRNGVVEYLEEVIESLSHPEHSAYKQAHNRIKQASMSLVNRTYAALEPMYDELRVLSIDRDHITGIINKARADRNIVISKIDGKAVHLSKVRSLEKEEIELKLRHAARIVKVEEFRDRYPNELSGGQQQRVAIARTLAPGPKVLFRDEPLSNLDAKLRLERRSELKRLHRETGATFVYVTHDQLEARTLATHICLLNNGVLQQYDAPLTVYRRPNNLFAADFVGNPAITFIETKVKEREDGSFYRTFFNNRHAIFKPNAPLSLEKEIETRDKEAAEKEEELLRLKKLRSYVEKGNKDTLFNYHRLTEDGELERRNEKVIEKDDYVLGIRPEFFVIAEEGKGLEGSVYSARPSGRETTIRRSVDKFLLTSVIFGDSDYKRNEKLEINVKGNNVLLFDKISGKRISSGSLTIVTD